jgi:hypothetical protein
MAVFERYSVGFNNVGSYQASARPYLTGGCDYPVSGSQPKYFEVKFPQVTKFIVIKNDGSPAGVDPCDMRFAFASGGLGETYNYVVLPASSSFSADFRVTKLYLMGDGATIGKATVIAGLTNITASLFVNSWEHTAGVGPPT